MSTSTIFLSGPQKNLSQFFQMSLHSIQCLTLGIYISFYSGNLKYAFIFVQISLKSTYKQSYLRHRIVPTSFISHLSPLILNCFQPIAILLLSTSLLLRRNNLRAILLSFTVGLQAKEATSTKISASFFVFSPDDINKSNAIFKLQPYHNQIHQINNSKIQNHFIESIFIPN